jgi:hypothetical protein
MAAQVDTDIQRLLEKMHDLLQELDRACLASRVAWKSFVRLREDIRVSSEALRPIRSGLYHQSGRPQSSAG